MTVMLYKHPGPHKIHGDKFDYTIVDEDAVEGALSDGWFLTTTEALKPKKEKPSKEDNAPPTRAEIEAKATELGIKFRSNTKDATLLKKIKAELNK